MMTITITAWLMRANSETGRAKGGVVPSEETDGERSLGPRIRAYRKRFGITQVALAERLGMHPSQLSRIEGDKETGSLAVEKLLRLINLLRLSRDEAEELVSLAGYEPLILDVGGGLGYSAPVVARSSYDRIHRALHRLQHALAHTSPDIEQQCIDSIKAHIESLAVLAEHWTTSDEKADGK